MYSIVESIYISYAIALGYISEMLPHPPTKWAAALAGTGALSKV